jgi:hypothetical protein
LQQRVQDRNAGARDFRVGVSQAFSDRVHSALHLKWCGGTLGEQVVEGEKRRLAMRPGRCCDGQRLQLRGDFFFGSSRRCCWSRPRSRRFLHALRRSS